ncbi:FAD-binding oxidoreductase [Aspergillus undulatus]|uniref:FAD-binding oxidoreductase n=1 Tax=Aspergillus undulatus TaxID=1810928 RepID=UPI003CCDA8D8
MADATITSPISPTLGACCAALSSALGNKVSFPNTEPYNASVNSYFSQQNANLRPLCIVSPVSTEDVSIAISQITSSTTSSFSPEEQSRRHCLFAIRSGGHASHGGASNIDGGITIDLSGLNTITLSDDQSTVSAGVGATWGDVYAFLEPLGLSVPGGRAAQVGVGGLTLGGGISYFSPRYGWTCDTATTFEVVLANGEIVQANEESDPGLLTSLRGGGSNFGVVTRIEFRTFRQGLIWGGMAYYSLDTIDQQLRAFEKLNSVDKYDEHASLITSFGFAKGQGGAVVNSIVYTKDEESPEVYKLFLEIPSLYSSIRTLGVTEMSKVQGSFQVNGKRELSITITHDSTFPVLKATYHRWNTSLSAIQGIDGIHWSLSLEPLPPAIYARAPQSNALGFDKRQKALVVTVLSATWESDHDDALVQETARALFAGIEEDARHLGSYDPFVYMNYAAKWQDPVASYGEESVRRLRGVSKSVDPRGVFKAGGSLPGGFKIPGFA